MLSGHMQLGGSFMGIRGDFHLEVSFLTHEQDGIVWYTLFIGGGASVEVYFDFKIFEISLGVGLDLSVSADSRDADANGDVPLRFRITVRFKILGSWYSRSDTFTIGTVNFPVVPYLAGNTVDYGAGDVRNNRAWTAGDDQLWLNVGEAAGAFPQCLDGRDRRACLHRAGRSDERDGLATIRITAFGYTRTYEHVRRISANFGVGADNLVIDPSVQIPVTIDAGGGTDTILLQGSGVGEHASAAAPRTTRSRSAGSASADRERRRRQRHPASHRHRRGHAERRRRRRPALRQQHRRQPLRRRRSRRALGLAGLYDGGRGMTIITATVAVFTSAVAQVVDRRFRQRQR